MDDTGEGGEGKAGLAPSPSQQNRNVVLSPASMGPTRAVPTTRLSAWASNLVYSTCAHMHSNGLTDLLHY
jgi:hypothetical protein